MKKLFFILILIASLAVGCKKYDEGPWLSLRSAENRLYGYYSINTYNVNQADSLSLFNDSLYKIFHFFYDEKSNTTGFTIKGVRNDGKFIDYGAEWNFNNNKTKLIVTYSQCYANLYPSGTGPFLNHAKPEWVITRLTNKAITMRTTYNNKEYLIKLEANK